MHESSNNSSRGLITSSGIKMEPNSPARHHEFQNLMIDTKGAGTPISPKNK